MSLPRHVCLKSVPQKGLCFSPEQFSTLCKGLRPPWARCSIAPLLCGPVAHNLPTSPTPCCLPRAPVMGAAAKAELGGDGGGRESWAHVSTSIFIWEPKPAHGAIWRPPRDTLPPHLARYHQLATCLPCQCAKPPGRGQHLPRHPGISFHGGGRGWHSTPGAPHHTQMPGGTRAARAHTHPTTSSASSVPVQAWPQCHAVHLHRTALAQEGHDSPPAQKL